MLVVHVTTEWDVGLVARDFCGRREQAPMYIYSEYIIVLFVPFGLWSLQPTAIVPGYVWVKL